MLPALSRGQARSKLIWRSSFHAAEQIVLRQSSSQAGGYTTAKWDIVEPGDANLSSMFSQLKQLKPTKSTKIPNNPRASKKSTTAEIRSAAEDARELSEDLQDPTANEGNEVNEGKEDEADVVLRIRMLCLRASLHCTDADISECTVELEFLLHELCRREFKLSPSQLTSLVFDLEELDVCVCIRICVRVCVCVSVFVCVCMCLCV